MAIDFAAEAAAESLSALLKYASPDRLPSVESVARFMRVNGIPAVRAAMTMTQKRLKLATRGSQIPVENPWDYVRGIVNGRPARARYLYLLLFLWETSLRSRIDLTLKGPFGADWFRDPGVYLSEANATWLFNEHPLRGQLFVASAAGQYGHLVAPSILFVDGLLDRLFLENLHNIVADCWKEFGPIFLPAVGTKTHLQSAMHTAIRARRETMHAGEISNALFRQSSDALRLLLEALEFDVDKTLRAIEKRDPHKEDFELFE